MLTSRLRHVLRHPLSHANRSSTLLNHRNAHSDIKERGSLQHHRFPDYLEKWSPTVFKRTSAVALALSGAAFGVCGFASALPYVIAVPSVYLSVLGYRDMKQKKHTILRNFPVLGHIRFIFESFRPEIRQYFVESDNDPTPFSRADRSVVYQRAKEQEDALSFGTRLNVYEPGYEFLRHSIFPVKVAADKARVMVGTKLCKQPYSASLFNVSGMSFGALSPVAILALNGAAKDGGFYHNTGEGGVSEYHLSPGGDLVWNIGTGYFGCRTPDGKFCPDNFAEKAQLPQIKMIEIKLSQGAKPGKGGMLPGAKVTQAIADTRGVDAGQDCISPFRHTAFNDAKGLLEFANQLRELSGGKPVGIKMCVGLAEEAASIARAMVETGLLLDFITVDGAEGGTGAAPAEFSNHVGTPTTEGLRLWSALLDGTNLRQEGVRLIAAGKVTGGFKLVKMLALGADIINAARPMMFALGCIQATKCHLGTCPSGVATQDEELQKGLHVPTKRVRVAKFQKATVDSALALIGAAGVDDPALLTPAHIMRRITLTSVRAYSKEYAAITPGCLLPDGKGTDTAPKWLTEAWDESARLYKQQ